MSFRLTFFLIILQMMAIHHYGCAQDKSEDKDKDNIVEVVTHPEKFYKKFFPNLRIKVNPPDSLYIKTYPNYLSVSSHILLPDIKFKLSPGATAGESRFSTNVPYIVGFNVGYRFVTAGFATLTRIHPHEGYAESHYRTATVRISVKALSMQYRFSRVKGLTDTNFLNSIDSEHLLQRADIVNRDFQLDIVYNPDWRRYSYQSTFSFSQQQVKSRAGFLFNVGVYYSRMTGDSALIQPRQQSYFNDFDDVQIIRSVSIRLAPGAGGTWVMSKKFYVSAVVFPVYDLLFYRYLDHPHDHSKPHQTFAFVLDSRFGAGYQSKRFYAGVRYELERKYAKLDGLNITNKYSFVGLEIGYRFNAPKYVKKVYKETMPPGA